MARPPQLALELDPAAERAARAVWKGAAARLQFGGCDRCGRVRGDDGRPLLVARQERRRRFECFACWASARHR